MSGEDCGTRIFFGANFLLPERKFSIFNTEIPVTHDRSLATRVSVRD